MTAELIGGPKCGEKLTADAGMHEYRIAGRAPLSLSSLSVHATSDQLIGTYRRNDAGDFVWQGWS